MLNAKPHREKKRKKRKKKWFPDPERAVVSVDSKMGRKAYWQAVDKAKKASSALRKSAAIRKVSDPSVYFGPVVFNKPKENK